jgi:hypothetical protein
MPTKACTVRIIPVILQRPCKMSSQNHQFDRPKSLHVITSVNPVGKTHSNLNDTISPGAVLSTALRHHYLNWRISLARILSRQFPN